MTYSIGYRQESSQIEVCFQGELTGITLRNIIADEVRLSQEHGCYQILDDYRQANLGLSTFELYRMVKLSIEMIVGAGLDPYRLRQAIVVTQNLGDYQFFENACNNQGLIIRVFQSIQEAQQWLLCFD